MCARAVIRVVFDTVVFVRSLINPYGPWGTVVFARSGDYVLFLSRPVIEEILEVIERPSIKRKYRVERTGGVAQLLDVIGRARVVEPAPIAIGSRDHKDDKFLATAVAASADYLVSEDRDLLDLKEYDGTKIVDVQAFLAILESLRGREQ